jgi:hypothetical protein
MQAISTTPATVGIGLSVVETTAKEALYDCFLFRTLAKSNPNCDQARVSAVQLKSPLA